MPKRRTRNAVIDRQSKPHKGLMKEKNITPCDLVDVKSEPGSIMKDESVMPCEFVDVTSQPEDELMLEIQEVNWLDIKSEDAEDTAYESVLPKSEVKEGEELISSYENDAKECDPLLVEQDNEPTSRSFNCMFCEESFSQYADISKHLAIHYPERRFKCPFCDSVFLQERNVEQHIRKKHERINLNKSVQRDPGTLQKNSIEYLPVHTLERPYKCSMCDSVCKNENSLKFHIRIKHKMNFSNKPLQQDHGNKETFESSSTLTALHLSEPSTSLKRVHKTISLNGELHYAVTNGLFKCIFCQMSYFKHNNFSQHLQRHLGRYLYICPHCKKTFITKRFLETHICTEQSNVWSWTKSIVHHEQIE